MQQALNYSQSRQIKSWLGSGSINIFGTPFAGKDTQGKRLAEFFDAPLIGGGEIIRSGNNEELKASIADGKLAPTDAYLAVVTPYLSQPAFEGKTLVLSSVGRWIGEEKVITEAATKSGHPQKAVIFLELSEEEIRKRWQAAHDKKDRGDRDDDRLEALETRLDEFKNKTQPVIDYYEKVGLLIRVNGIQPPDDVTKAIFSALLSFAR